MNFKPVLLMVALTACAPIETRGGPCPEYSPYAGPLLKAKEQACKDTLMIEQAKARGAAVTTCVRTDSGATCVSE